MKILLATSNPHKLEEIQAISQAAGADLSFVGLADLGLSLDEPVEDQPSFEGNALIKARYYAKAAQIPCVADDSGLEVDALGGAPGVHSARFSGQAGGRDIVDPANNLKLMQALGDLPLADRTARFVCAMACVWPENSDVSHEPIVLRGTFEGQIITAEQAQDPAAPARGRGENGFGYDPLFWLPQRGCTSAQLTPDQKNAVSHRGQATRLMIDRLCRETAD